MRPRIVTLQAVLAHHHALSPSGRAFYKALSKNA